MAFCSNCGHPLTGNEKFCAECGADTATKTANAPAANFAPGPAPAPAAIPMPQPIASTPYPGVPVVVGVPPPVQPAQQKKGMMSTVVVIILVAGIGYYFYSKSHTPAATPAPTPAPTAQNPPASGSGSGGGGNAALVNQQTFDAHWQDQSGMLVLTTRDVGQQFDHEHHFSDAAVPPVQRAGTDLSEYRVTLNGPTNAKASSTFSNVGLGATATGMAKVDCSIIHVKP